MVSAVNYIDGQLIKVCSRRNYVNLDEICEGFCVNVGVTFLLSDRMQCVVCQEK